MFRPGHFPLPHMLACIKAAEDAGFDHIWFGDSHLIWHEVGPYLTAAAMSTKRMRVGPLVSNPVTRHPTVVASMLATLGQLFDGRAVLGIGRGDSAVRTLGLPPLKLAEVRDALRLMRRLRRGQAAEAAACGAAGADRGAAAPLGGGEHARHARPALRRARGAGDRARRQRGAHARLAADEAGGVSRCAAPHAPALPRRGGGGARL